MKNTRGFNLFARLMLALLVTVGSFYGSGFVGHALAATDYHVGPDQMYVSIGDVPWGSLGPGDRVLIHWRPEPYNEKFLVSGQGEASAPIHILGVPGDYGQRPIISGENASYSSNMNYADAGSSTDPGDAGLGVIVIKKPAGAAIGYKPQHIIIDGLEIQGGKIGNTVTSPSGAVLPNHLSTSAIYVTGADHVTIRNCSIVSSSRGVWAESGSTEDTLTRNLIIEGNYLNDNGYVGGPERSNDLDHNIDTEVAGITVQYNQLNLMAEGSKGSQFKDRSSGTVFRYNNVRGSSHLLELVEPVSGALLLTAEPSFQDVYVYGNAFTNEQTFYTSQFPYTDKLFRWGGEIADSNSMRNGTLYFYQNTVVVKANKSSLWSVKLFDMPDNNHSVDARNNIFFSTPSWEETSGPELRLLHEGLGNLDMGVNYITPGWSISGSESYTGSVTGIESFISPQNNNIAFQDLPVLNLRLHASSPAVNSGGPLSPDLAPEMLPSHEYEYHYEYGHFQYMIPRLEVGAPDLGAFEFGSSGPADTDPPEAPTGLTATYISPTQVDLAWNVAADNPGGSGILQYMIYFNGVGVGIIFDTNFSAYYDSMIYNASLIQPGKVYTITVKSIDMAGNESVESVPVIVTTPALYGPPGYLYDGQVDLVFGSTSSAGGSIANLAYGHGYDGGYAIRYSNLDNWDRTVPVVYDLPADISGVTATEFVMQVKLSQESAGGSPMRIVFNGVSWEGAPMLTFTPEAVTDFQTITIALPEGFMDLLDDGVASFYFERIGTPWPTGSTAMVIDDVRFE